MDRFYFVRIMGILISTELVAKAMHSNQYSEPENSIDHFLELDAKATLKACPKMQLDNKSFSW